MSRKLEFEMSTGWMYGLVGPKLKLLTQEEIVKNMN